MRIRNTGSIITAGIDSYPIIDSHKPEAYLRIEGFQTLESIILYLIPNFRIKASKNLTPFSLTLIKVSSLNPVIQYLLIKGFQNHHLVPKGNSSPNCVTPNQGCQRYAFFWSKASFFFRAPKNLFCFFLLRF